MKFRFASLFLIGALCYGFYCYALWLLTDGFSLSKIGSTLTPQNRWSVDNPPETVLKEILSQNYYYIGRGSQCFVFESEDRNSVLKFFRQERFRLSNLNKFITSPHFLTQIIQDKHNLKRTKQEALFQSCHLAFNELKEESGLLYLHLNKTDNLGIEVTLYDKIKRPFTISIDNYEFIIQKRGEQLYTYLNRLLAEGRRHEVKEALTNVISLLSRRIHKNIADHDAVIEKNSGFRGKHPFFLDIGGFFRPQHPIHSQIELQRSTTSLRAWLAKKDPELAHYFEELY